MQISDKQRNDTVVAHTNNVDGGPAAGTLEFRTGAPPATPASPDSGTLLCTLTYGDPSYGAPTAGSANANGLPLTDTVVADGTVAHYREKDSTGTVISQGTVTGTAGGGDFEFDSTGWTINDTINLNSLTYSAPV